MSENVTSLAGVDSIDIESRLVQLMRDYRKYRYLVIIFATCCIAVLAVVMGLFKSGIIDGDVQFAIILASYLFVALVLFLVFARIRPIKADIRAWNRAVANVEEKPTKHNRRALRELAESIDDSNDTQFSKRPPTPEYKKWHRIWYGCIAAAVAVLLVDMAIIRINPSSLELCVGALVLSYAFIIAAIYLEVRKLKPMRESWRLQQRKNQRKQRR